MPSNARMMRQFDWSEDFLTEICIAPEAPEELGGFRKPSPRFELEMARKYGLDSSASWVVGDKWSDAQTGLSAGMRGALVRTGKPIDRKTELLSEEKGVKIHLNLWQFVTEELGL
ncbi:MAG: HAD hydrolase-like protein [Rickettsiales bacterium]